MCTPYSLLYAHFTLHPTPNTLHAPPSTLHPPPCTLHPIPYTLSPTPYILHLCMRACAHPARYTPHPKPCTLHPSKSHTVRPKAMCSCLAWCMHGAGHSHCCGTLHYPRQVHEPCALPPRHVPQPHSAQLARTCSQCMCQACMRHHVHMWLVLRWGLECVLRRITGGTMNASSGWKTGGPWWGHSSL